MIGAVGGGSIGVVVTVVTIGVEMIVVVVLTGVRVMIVVVVLIGVHVMIVVVVLKVVAVTTIAVMAVVAAMIGVAEKGQLRATAGETMSNRGYLNQHELCTDLYPLYCGAEYVFKNKVKGTEQYSWFWKSTVNHRLMIGLKRRLYLCKLKVSMRRSGSSFSAGIHCIPVHAKRKVCENEMQHVCLKSRAKDAQFEEKHKR